MGALHRFLSRHIHSDTNCGSDSEGATNTVVSLGPRHLHRTATAPVTPMSSGSLTSASTTVGANQTRALEQPGVTSWASFESTIVVATEQSSIFSTPANSVDLPGYRLHHRAQPQIHAANLHTTPLSVTNLRAPRPPTILRYSSSSSCPMTLTHSSVPWTSLPLPSTQNSSATISTPYIWILPPPAQTLVPSSLEQSDDA